MMRCGGASAAQQAAAIHKVQITRQAEAERTALRMAPVKTRVPGVPEGTTAADVDTTPMKEKTIPRTAMR